MITAELRRRIADWAAQDPDSATRAEAEALLERSDAGDDVASAELVDAFGGRLAFGTAGLRGALGPGPNRMNRVVVAQAAAGLAAWLRGQGHVGGTVVVGFDARHNSDVFARDSAEILAGAGFRPILADFPLPTPVTAYAIRHLGAVAGVVVTASHNPPRDNGYKVYVGDGSQIVPPVDAEIAAQIDAVAGGRLDALPRSAERQSLREDVIQAYLDRVASLVDEDAPRDLRWVYTPLHGVGGSIVLDAADRAGFAPPALVPAQADPDPDFPTVRFPNPEEPGAIDLALRLAAELNADLVVANDPDADRCAVAVPVPAGEGAAEPGWRMLTGDELGALLGDDALRRGRHGTYAASIVSSSLLAAMAAEHDQPYASTLTGFKWIARVPGLVYGYEEALGYCVDPQAVADKDGVSALIRVLALAAELRARGGTLTDRLDDIARAYGVYATDQLAVRVDDLELITAAMARLRADPPHTLVGEPVEVVDLAAANGPGPRPLDLPPTDAILITGPSIKVVARPSGTEPKLKCYLEARISTTSSTGLAADRARARDLLARLRGEMAEALGVSAN